VLLGFSGQRVTDQAFPKFCTLRISIVGRLYRDIPDLQHLVNRFAIFFYWFTLAPCLLQLQKQPPTHRYTRLMQNTSLSFHDLTDPPPTAGLSDWNENGVVIVKNFFPDDLLLAYENLWLKENGEISRTGGWPDPIPYTRHEEIKDLLCWKPLTDLIENLIGEPPGLHLNLTGWVSTERDWHQDSYLNPPWVGDSYAAVWIAFDTIHPDSGPFQYVPGSHRWRQVTRDKILQALSPEERDYRWPKFSERLLTPLFEQEIINSGINPVSHLPERGDLLVWHGRVMHRGSKATISKMERRSLIAHYSGINHRKEMPKAIQHKNQGYYFPLQTDLNLYYGKENE
jgi:hypothetical protein